MAIRSKSDMAHAAATNTLPDVLERILEKGVVIAGDIKINLCDVELLTIQIRLVVCSVDKAMEMGIDWWSRDPMFKNLNQPETGDLFAEMEQRVERLEKAVKKA